MVHTIISNLKNNGNNNNNKNIHIYIYTYPNQNYFKMTVENLASFNRTEFFVKCRIAVKIFNNLVLYNNILSNIALQFVEKMGILAHNGIHCQVHSGYTTYIFECHTDI